MPTYVFKCRECGGEDKKVFTFSEFDKIKRDGGILCTGIRGLCQGIMETVIQHTSFSLKGRGWAKDGYSGGKK